MAEEQRQRAEPDGLAAQDTDDELPAPHQDGELRHDHQASRAESQRRGVADQIKDCAEIDRVEDHPECQHRHRPARRQDQFAARQAGELHGAVLRLRAGNLVGGTKHLVSPWPSQS
jgi:hypothetical protein